MVSLLGFDHDWYICFMFSKSQIANEDRLEYHVKHFISSLVLNLSRCIRCILIIFSQRGLTA